VIVRNLQSLFAKVPDVLIDDYGSLKDWFQEALHEGYWKQLIQSPQDEAPGDSPLLHLRQRMQLMTTTISTMMMHQPLHQSHLPRVDAHLRHPLCVTTQDETTASVIVEVMR